MASGNKDSSTTEKTVSATKGKRHNKKNKITKPKLTKEERRAKYTKLALDRRDRKKKSARNRNLICFRCRGKGHAAADCTVDITGDNSMVCPPVNDGNGANNNLIGGGNICYMCGATEHRLSACPKLNNGRKRNSNRKLDYSSLELPFATCFLCGGKGHLSSSCKKNQKGIFINGGSCRICNAVTHIAADCPQNEKNKNENSSSMIDDCNNDGVVVDDLLEDAVHAEMKDKQSGKEKKKDVKPKKKKVVKF